MKLTNKDRQKELDFIKWNLSQVEKKDMSGQMDYCNYCTRRNADGSCTVSQEDKEINTICAKAFNKREKK